VASPAQDDQLLLEQEILRDHRSHATGATQLRGHDGQMKKGEQKVRHARDSVGQTSGATQRCPNPGFSERILNPRRTALRLDHRAFWRGSLTRVGDIKFDPKRVQTDLITLGYLPAGAADGKWGPGSKRALTRFKRRARSLYRISTGGQPADCTAANAFQGIVDESVTQPTLDEIAKWLRQSWKAPLGRFSIKGIGNGKLRQDVADAWIALIASVAGHGGTIEGPYGDTMRPLGKAKKAGASSFSFHIVGRAVDLKQELTNRPNRRYYVAKDVTSGASYWRIYCSTQNQDGSQGSKFAKGKVDYWDFVDQKAINIPEGHYVDLTDEIEKGGLFERIPAQSGWESTYNRAEWWHFQWKPDKQETFQDECELVGISETALRNAGYSELDMDRKPG
jgi:hypothetical protein